MPKTGYVIDTENRRKNIHYAFVQVALFTIIVLVTLMLHFMTPSSGNYSEMLVFSPFPFLIAALIIIVLLVWQYSIPKHSWKIFTNPENISFRIVGHKSKKETLKTFPLSKLTHVKIRRLGANTLASWVVNILGVLLIMYLPLAFLGVLILVPVLTYSLIKKKPFLGDYYFPQYTFDFGKESVFLEGGDPKELQLFLEKSFKDFGLKVKKKDEGRITEYCLE